MKNSIGSLRYYLKGLRSVRTGALLEPIKRFGNERSGNAALLFGLALVPLTFLIGMAVDFPARCRRRLCWMPPPTIQPPSPR